MYVYKTTSRFTSARKCKLIKLPTFIGCLYLSKYLNATQNGCRQFVADVIMFFFSKYVGNCRVLT